MQSPFAAQKVNVQSLYLQFELFALIFMASWNVPPLGGRLSSLVNPRPYMRDSFRLLTSSFPRHRVAAMV